MRRSEKGERDAEGGHRIRAQPDRPVVHALGTASWGGGAKPADAERDGDGGLQGRHRVGAAMVAVPPTEAGGAVCAIRCCRGLRGGGRVPYDQHFMLKEGFMEKAIIDQTIDDLLAAEAVTADDLFVAQQNGTAKKVSGDTLRRYVGQEAGLPKPTIEGAFLRVRGGKWTEETVPAAEGGTF